MKFILWFSPRPLRPRRLICSICMRGWRNASMTVRCGIIGGMGPESTLDYYRLMVEHYRDGQDTGYPELTIDIVDLKPILRFLEAGNRQGLADYVLDSIDRLVRAGCTFAALTSNTS